jgi:uncharacterized protein
MNGVSEDLKPILVELRSELRRCLGDELVGVYLYGSYARGEQTQDSDIDVLVVVRDDSKRAELMDRTLNAVASVSLKHDTLISDTIVSEDRFRSAQSPLLINARREAVPV